MKAISTEATPRDMLSPSFVPRAMASKTLEQRSGRTESIYMSHHQPHIQRLPPAATLRRYTMYIAPRVGRGGLPRAVVLWRRACQGTTASSRSMKPARPSRQRLEGVQAGHPFECRLAALRRQRSLPIRIKYASQHFALKKNAQSSKLSAYVRLPSTGSLAITSYFSCTGRSRKIA